MRLSVLAPHSYYDGLAIDWLAVGLSQGLRTLGIERRGIHLSFAFEALPRSFWPGSDDSGTVGAR